jgi:hypothetical protein
MMDLFCRFGSHVAQDRAISNDGFEFSKCRRCGCALVRRDSETWRELPKGYRIVWKQRTVERRRAASLHGVPEQGYFHFH